MDGKRYEQRKLERKLALGYLELWDKFTGGKSINPATMDTPVAGSGTGGDFLYDALVSFATKFDDLEWWYLQVLYRPDIKIPPSTARKIGIRLRFCWRRVMRDAGYFESAVDSYYHLVGWPD